MNKLALATGERLKLEFYAGRQIGNLTVTGLPVRVPAGKNAKHWHIPLQCECGKLIKSSVSHLRSGHTVSCGCAKINRISKLNATHGFTSDVILKKLYSIYSAMKQRCRIKNLPYDPAWRNRLNFLVWSIKNGYAPGLFLDRINNSRGYSPSNCRYVDDIQSANNRTTSHLITVDGVTKTIAEHCREKGVSYNSVHSRISRGWEDARLFEGGIKEEDSASCFVYLAHNKNLLSVGRSCSLPARKKKLAQCGFTVLSAYKVPTPQDSAFMEFMLLSELKSKGIPLCAGNKTPDRRGSFEVFDKKHAKGFKFRKQCLELSSKLPMFKAELLEKFKAGKVALENSTVCHQKLKRDETLCEDLRLHGPTLGHLSDLRVSHFNMSLEPLASEHKDFIKRYEWLGNSGYGIKWCFVARHLSGLLGGVVLMSEPYHPAPDTALIARGACASWTPKNLGSSLVMFSCRWMVANTDKRKFIAYADTEAKEIGSIYQACNFTYLGEIKTSYGVDAEGKRRSYQSIKRTSAMVPWLARQGITLNSDCFTAKGYLRWSKIPPDIKQLMREHVISTKSLLETRQLIRHRYMLVLGRNKTETKALRAEVCSLPYPKRAH